MEVIRFDSQSVCQSAIIVSPGEEWGIGGWDGGVVDGDSSHVGVEVKD